MVEAHSINAEHKDLIHDVAFDYYGERMATCSTDQFVKVSNSIGYLYYTYVRSNIYNLLFDINTKYRSGTKTNKVIGI